MTKVSIADFGPQIINPVSLMNINGIPQLSPLYNATFFIYVKFM